MINDYEKMELTKIAKLHNKAFDLRVQYIQSMLNIIRGSGIDDEAGALRALATMSPEIVEYYREYADSVDFVFPDV